MTMSTFTLEEIAKPLHLVGSRVPRDRGRAGRASLPGFAIASLSKFKPLLALFVALSTAAASSSTPTLKIPLADGWRFMKGDDPTCKVNLSQGNMSAILDQALRVGTWG